MKAPKVLILAGDGVNCERESALAVQLAQGLPQIMHVNDLLSAPERLRDYQALVLPGGFSYGDELGSGKLLALKLKYGLLEHLQDLLGRKAPVLGICNGFQVLVKLGLLPNWQEPRSLSLAPNDTGAFLNRWASLHINHQNPGPWAQKLKQFETIELPVRHGEGRIVLAQGREQEIYQQLQKQQQILFTYSEDINGSYEKIAGLTDPSGLVLGMMPHPEAALFKATHYEGVQDYDQPSYGSMMFSALMDYIKAN